MDENVVLTPGVVALAIVLVTQAAKEHLPRLFTKSVTILFTFVLGPALMSAAWATGFTPPGMTWHRAVIVGFLAAVVANGGYASLKGLIEAREDKAAGQVKG